MTKLQIQDLRNPVLSPVQQAAMGYAEENPVCLTPQAVLTAASRATGLDNFGARDFEDRMQIWLDEIGQDPNRTALARSAMFRLCVKYAANRLRIEDLLERYPEIHDQQIKEPVFVTGLPRSGTTHLVNLLAADTRFRSLPLWEADQPVPARGEGPGRDGIDPRFRRCAQAWQQMQQNNPYLAAWHTMAADSIHEDIELWSNNFAGYSPEWIFAMLPQWQRHYLAHDQTRHYEYLRTVLKILQWYAPGERWLLKCPQHMEYLPALNKVFPDATIVMTQRDPVGVVQSAATLRAYGARTMYHQFEVGDIFEYWVGLIERLLRSCERDRPLVPQILDIPFGEYMADTMGTVAAVYQFAGIELTDTARGQIEQYVTANPRDKHGSMSYDLRGDFDITPEDLRTRFSFYLDRHPVPAEVF